MNVRQYIRPDIVASAIAHLSVLAALLVLTEVHPFGGVTAEPITVDIVRLDEVGARSSLIFSCNCHRPMFLQPTRRNSLQVSPRRRRAPRRHRNSSPHLRSRPRSSKSRKPNRLSSRHSHSLNRRPRSSHRHRRRNLRRHHRLATPRQSLTSL